MIPVVWLIRVFAKGIILRFLIVFEFRFEKFTNGLREPSCLSLKDIRDDHEKLETLMNFFYTFLYK